MTIEAQVTRLGLRVEEFVRSVASLEEELFLKKLNGWSPRDIVAHLTGWNLYMIEGSKQIKRSELPFYDVDPGENYSKVNAVLVRKYSSTNKQELLDELRTTTQELQRFLQSIDSSEWDRDYGVRHQGAVITIKNSVDELIDDYDAHRAEIEEWAKRSEAR
ncbi:MAG: ClbS/DfsB family four-helix bundle protein [Candidatus Aminicenantes bacterium]|nr:ClbS/DfsB family four-helix bundle protein [Candidatus Aminicenantes bacterium]